MYENEIEELSLKCNKLAMDYLQADKFKESLSLLQRAESLLKSEDSIPNRLKLLSITFNNFGCYYKKKKQPNMALKYLKDSLDIEMQTELDNINLASTHLNICAILSSIGRHEQACKHARQSLSLLEKCTEYNPNLITNLVISYYNCGVELEYLLLKEDALKYYEMGYQVALKELGINHTLTQSLENMITTVAISIKSDIFDRTTRNSSQRRYKSNRTIKGKLPNIMHNRVHDSFSYGNGSKMHRTTKSFF